MESYPTICTEKGSNIEIEVYTEQNVIGRCIILRNAYDNDPAKCNCKLQDLKSKSCNTVHFAFQGHTIMI